MTPLHWISYLVFSFIGLSHIPVNPTFSTSNQQYGVTALLNDTNWFGSAFAQREYAVKDDSCTLNRFALGLYTDIPHSFSGNEPIGGVTGCTGKCIPTQQIGFIKIPLAVGKYKISDFQDCIRENTQTAAYYDLIVGGDVAVDRYFPLGVTIWQGQKLVTIPGTDDSWIAVTKYDKMVDQIEGSFEIRLKNLLDQEVRFTKGSFRVKLTR